MSNMGTLYDTVKNAQQTKPVDTKVVPSVLSPVQDLSLYKGEKPQKFELPKKELSFYEKIKQKSEDKAMIAERKPMAEALFPTDTSFKTTTQGSTSPYPTGDISIQELVKVAGQGIARGYASTGSRLASDLGTASTDTIDPNTYFGDSEMGKKAAKAIFGTDQPFNATSEDIAFMETFGVDPNITREKAGGSLTMLLSALDLTGAGGSIKGLSGAVKAIRATKTTEEALKLAKSLKLSDEVAQQYADAFVNAQTVKEAKTALEEAVGAQEGRIMVHGGPAELDGGKIDGSKGFSGGAFFAHDTPTGRAYANGYTMKEAVNNKGGGKIHRVLIDKDAKLFDSTNPEHIKMIESKMGKDVSNDIVSTSRNGVMDWATGSQYLDEIKDLGFDGAHLSERPKGFKLYEPGTNKLIEAAEDVNSVVIFNESKFKMLPDLLPTPKELPPIKQVNKIAKTPKSEAKIPTNAQIDELSKKVKELGTGGKKALESDINDLATRVAISEDAIETLPGKQLSKYVSKTTGNLPEITGKETMQSLTGSGKTVKNSEFGKRGDEILDEIYGGNVPDIAKVEEDLRIYQKSREQLDSIKTELSSKRKDIATVRKAERMTRIGMRERRTAFRAVRERYNLTEGELKRFRKGRDISSMDQYEFDQFIAEANKYGEETEKQSNALVQLKATIAYKNLKKWENLAQAMNLPPVSKMNTEQLVNLERILDTYKEGDEFLPTRMLETIDRTKLEGVKTVREVLERLGKEEGLTVEEVSKIHPSEFHRYMDDVTLARQNPFYSRLVTIKNESFMKANARIVKITDEVDALIEKARASVKQSITDKIIPTDQNMVHWLEGDALTRSTLEKTMTAEELAASKKMDEVFKSYYDYLVERKAGQKFSRFEDQYFPHVRRGFLEAWKEDGVLKAFKELRDQFAQDQKYMNILNEQTGDILPYEKWIGFTQFRSDNLVPTANAARAFESYVTVLEKARHLDEMTPEIMAYVHALSPRTMSQRGIELDNSLKRFVKEWINANKGRHPKGFFEPGGKLDFALRASSGFTRMVDLGFNFTTQIVAPIGENAMTLTMLKPKNYAKAVARVNTKEGKQIIEKYKSFVGRSLFEELSRATASIGDKFSSGMFGIYHYAARQSNELFLLGKMTDEEFKTGTISAERLAKLRVEMGRYRKIEGLESIMGRTSEAKAALQYKSWAYPILRETVYNTQKIIKMMRSEGVRTALASEQGKELFYSIGLSAAIGGFFYNEYKSLSGEKDRSFVEDMLFKSLRDAQSIFGAFDPTMWADIRVISFYQDFAQAILDAVMMNEYKTTGELKAPKEFMDLITPAPIRQLEKIVSTDTKGTATKSPSVETPAGLPKLPSATKKLPTPPGLPSLD